MKDSRANNIIGKRLGMLTISKLLVNVKDSQNCLYDAICDCGKNTTITRKAFTTKKKHSCGCKNTNAQVMIAKSKFSSCKGSAKSRGHEFKLTFEEFQSLILNDCYYCNKPAKEIKLDNKKWIAKFRKNIKVYANGLDRVDNRLGYVINNVVACCEECNMSKASVTTNIASKMLKFLNKHNHKVVIEIPSNDSYKYEIDKQTGNLTLDRPLNQPIPYNYGYFNSTLAEDGDQLDVFVISKQPIVSLSEVEVNIMGIMYCKDNGIPDHKIIATVKKENMYAEWNKELDKIVNYLKTYKNGFEYEMYAGEQHALQELKICKQRYTSKS